MDVPKSPSEERSGIMETLDCLQHKEKLLREHMLDGGVRARNINLSLETLKLARDVESLLQRILGL